MASIATSAPLSDIAPNGMVDVLGTHMANAAHLGGLAVGLLQGWHDGRKARS